MSRTQQHGSTGAKEGTVEATEFQTDPFDGASAGGHGGLDEAAEPVPVGNAALKALRLGRHWTQQDFSAAFEAKSRELGRSLSLSVRQVRRWESEHPPCPLPAYQRVLEALFGVAVTAMGFRPSYAVPWAPRPEQPDYADTGFAGWVGTEVREVREEHELYEYEGTDGAWHLGEHGRRTGAPERDPRPPASRLPAGQSSASRDAAAAPPGRGRAPADGQERYDPVRRREFMAATVALGSIPLLPERTRAAAAPSGDLSAYAERLSAATDGMSHAAALDPGMVAGYESITGQQRRLYWAVSAPRMYKPVAAHAQFGGELLQHGGSGPLRTRLAASVAQTTLLAARIAFFDLQAPDAARAYYQTALAAAREADDHELGSAILAHLAFIPTYAGQASEARDLMRAAYAHAARGVSAAHRAWLHAVDAEVEAKLGDGQRAIDLIGRAEDAIVGGSRTEDPEWLDFFDAARLIGFKGFCQLSSGRADQAHDTLRETLLALPQNAVKQRSIVYADLGACAARQAEVEESCRLLTDALHTLENHWYATAMDRVHGVRRDLDPFRKTRPVRQLDEALFSWNNTLAMSAR